jgi:hypothetical protein
VDAKLKGTCLEISQRYEIEFLEIGVDQNQYFLPPTQKCNRSSGAGSSGPTGTSLSIVVQLL